MNHSIYRTTLEKPSASSFGKFAEKIRYYFHHFDFENTSDKRDRSIHNQGKAVTVWARKDLHLADSIRGPQSVVLFVQD